jgi:hypothetical protein
MAGRAMAGGGGATCFRAHPKTPLRLDSPRVLFIRSEIHPKIKRQIKKPMQENNKIQTVAMSFFVKPPLYPSIMALSAKW